MLLASLSAILIRDLRTLRREIDAYPDTDAIWRPHPGLPNSGGVLTRHLCGNLQHFIGKVLGETGYRRDRPAEFAAPPQSREALLGELTTTEELIASVLGRLPESRLTEPYPEAVGGQMVTTGDWLIQLAVHCAFHLGQVDYHRRAVTDEARSVAPMAIPELASARPARTGPAPTS